VPKGKEWGSTGGWALEKKYGKWTDERIEERVGHKGRKNEGQKVTYFARWVVE